ncbi:SipW-dependent-type signal peptide-containing protein [Microbacterium sp.]|uniref:SipW-dependent-type signal peptide-containing protein n=1 Tax=Microbacterium sp. TaxID=51671 RepID=UPI002C453097|nr:SipW-dependent-type signal peptide-containing protein [Propionicimonas sp.]
MAKHAAPRRRATRRGPRRRTGRIRAFLTLGIVLGLGSVSTLAYWTDTATISSGTIQSGSLNLQIDGEENVSSSTKLQIANMIPGESVAATIRVDRAPNSIPFTYGAQAVTANSNALATALRFKVYVGGTAGAVTTNGNGVRSQGCGGTQIWGGADGLTWTPQAAIITDRASALSTTPVQAGVVSEYLCVQAILPSATGTGAQSLSTSATLTFTATQLS